MLLSKISSKMEPLRLANNAFPPEREGGGGGASYMVKC